MADDDTSGHLLDLEDLETEPLEQLEVAPPPGSEPEVRSGSDRLCPDRAQVALGEHLGLERHQLGRERRDERRLGPGVREQLQPPFERGDQLDVVAERDPRMRIERDHRRRKPGVDRRLDDAPMASVHSVERADRDRALGCRSSWPGEWAIFTSRPRPDRPSRPEPDRRLPRLRERRAAGLLGLAIVQRLLPPLGLRLGDGEPDTPEGLLEIEDPLGVCLVDGERPDFRSPQTPRNGHRAHRQSIGRRSRS